VTLEKLENKINLILNDEIKKNISIRKIVKVNLEKNDKLKKIKITRVIFRISKKIYIKKINKNNGVQSPIEQA
jgi:hypothetical protein